MIVVGGGINGCGIAREAASRGLSVALFEMNDIGSGTSSRSSKLIHGGLRYLQSFQLGLVQESLLERSNLLSNAPHLVRPCPFLFPLYRTHGPKTWKMRAGMMLYDGLARFKGPGRHRMLNARQVSELEPLVRTEGLLTSPLYYDCSTDDARLTLENALDAHDLGATVINEARVCSIRPHEGRWSVEVERSGERRTFIASRVIETKGPWTDEGKERSHLRPTRGSHIVVARERLPLSHAIACVNPADKRATFAVPWGEVVYIGTTDTDDRCDPSDVHASADDVDYLLQLCAHFFPDAQLGREDVRSTWSGLRPLLQPNALDAAESDVSREHALIPRGPGFLALAGGKLTTYRAMCQEALEALVLSGVSEGADTLAISDSVSQERPLPGAQGWSDWDDSDILAREVSERSSGTLDLETSRFFVSTYGTSALELAPVCAADPDLAKPLKDGHLERRVQVWWAIHAELACAIDHVLRQRLQVFFKWPCQGLSVVELVATQMAAELDWDEERRELQIAEYRAMVQQTRKWMAEERPSDGTG